MNVTLQGTNLDLTDELRQFVDEKMQDALGALGRMNLDPVAVSVELERTTRRHPHEREDEQRYRAEANVSIPGRLIRAEASSPDLHQAIVQLKHTLYREVAQWHERVRREVREGARTTKAHLQEDALAAGEPPAKEEVWEEAWEEVDKRAEDEAQAEAKRLAEDAWKEGRTREITSDRAA